MNTKANSQRTWLETITTWPAYPVWGQLQWWPDCPTRHTGLLRRTGKETVRAEHLLLLYISKCRQYLGIQSVDRKWWIAKSVWDTAVVSYRQYTDLFWCDRKTTEKLPHRIGKTSWDSNMPPAAYRSIVLPLHKTMRRFTGISHQVRWQYQSPKLVNSWLYRQAYVLWHDSRNTRDSRERNGTGLLWTNNRTIWRQAQVCFQSFNCRFACSSGALLHLLGTNRLQEIPGGKNQAKPQNVWGQQI